MSWAKRNLYFLISCILAVALLGAAGWYCYSASQSNNANWDELSQAYTQLTQIATKNPGAGNETVNNIETARDQTKEVKLRVADMEKFFPPFRGIPNTNHFDDRVIAFAVRETVAQLRSGAVQHNVMLPTEFDFSFTLQEGKAIYDPNSWNDLSKQLGEVKAICDTLYGCRVASLDAVQRGRTADDANPNSPASGPDYVDSAAVTNQNTVITPYQITFECFTPELGGVLSAFANQSHTIVVKTLNIQPADLGSTSDAMMMQQGGAGGQLAANPRGGLPVVIDEKKLKVTMLLNFIKIIPAQGR
jgi:hypothetical protein